MFDQGSSIMDGIDYARRIQTNLLPSDSAMSDAFWDCSVIWKPRDIVGGDIYWMRQFDKGTILCVCDCTGHGIPGALLTMLVVCALEAIVKPHNCHDTAEIIWRLDKRLVDVLSTENSDATEIKDGCDLAVVFVARDGSVNISAGNTNVFYCDGNEVKRIRGQKIYVGEGKLDSKSDINTIKIPATAGGKNFYIATDGLFDQPGGATGAQPFGYTRFEKIILNCHNESQSAISEKIWSAFCEHSGNEPRVDDFALVTFKT